jgi:lipopolysaccharide biosynthesis glycosyltransferase
MTNKMCVVIACDESYLPHAATMLCSLLENNIVSIKIFLLHDGIKNKKLRLLEQFINKYNAEFEAFEFHDNVLSSLKINDHFTTLNYYRIFIPEILPADIGKVIYLDCDLIVRKPIDALWNIDLENHLLAAVENAFNEEQRGNQNRQLGLPPNSPYFNSGVMLIDVCKWRQESIHSRVINFITNYPGKISYVDQDGLNAVLCDQWLKLPLIWNLQSPIFIEPELRLRFAETISDPAIVHFTGDGIKPWQESTFQYSFYLEYNKYRHKTPWPRYKIAAASGQSYKYVLKEYAQKIVHRLKKLF